MRKFLLFTIIIFALTLPVYSQNYRVNLNVGNVGLGSNFPLYGSTDFEGSVSLINFAVEEKSTNIGLEISPIKTFIWGYDYEYDYESESLPFSLLNLSFYWNFFNHFFLINNIYLGPFASVSYLFVNESILWDRYVFSAGLQMGLRCTFGNVSYNIISFETGYRLISGRSKYFVGVNIDLAVLFLTALYVQAIDPYYYH